MLGSRIPAGRQPSTVVDVLTPTILDNQPRLLLVVVCWHELPRAALSVAPVISLSGLNWALLCIFPGEIAEGNGKRQIIIDERADEAQRSALETIISGEACVPLSNHFSVFGSLCAEFVETLFLPIDLEVDLKLRTAKVDIPGVVRSRGRPIINKFNGEPFHIALARSTGSFEFTYGEIGRGATAVTGDLEMAFEDSWALFCVHHYNQDGLIR